MRNISYGLGPLRKPLAPKLIEQKRQNNRRRKREERKHADPNGIPQKPPEIIIRKEILKMLQPHPAAFQKPFGRLIIHKRNTQSEHGTELKNQIIHNNGQQHEIQHPISGKIKP